MYVQLFIVSKPPDINHPVNRTPGRNLHRHLVGTSSLRPHDFKQTSHTYLLTSYNGSKDKRRLLDGAEIIVEETHFSIGKISCYSHIKHVRTHTSNIIDPHLLFVDFMKSIQLKPLNPGRPLAITAQWLSSTVLPCDCSTSALY